MAEPDPSAAVRIEVTLPAPFEVVWRWFRDPELICRWFGWDYESDEGGLEAEIRMIFVDGTGADEAGRTLHIGGHRFAYEAGAGDRATVVRVTRAALADGTEWTEVFYDDVEEGWISFLQQLRFTLALHPDDERRTLYLSGEPIEGAAAVSTDLGVDGHLPVGPDEGLTASIWFRSTHQVGFTVDAWGPGLLILAGSATAPADHPSSQAILTTYGLDEAESAALEERWTAWWSERHNLPG